MTEAVQVESGELATRIENLEKDLAEAEDRIEQLEDQSQTNVRVVDTESGKRILLDNSDQTWFSPNYFRKILDNMEEEST